MSVLMHFFSYLIELAHSFSNDYGVAIVMITIGVRLLLVPFNIRQRKQLSKQQETAGKAESIKKQYKNNQEKRDKELARLYQENGVGMGGCMISLLQFPIMICLYNAIRNITALECGTVLLPWVTSLLVRDRTFLLPIATVIVQILPQLYPYFGMFSGLKLQKQSRSTIVTLLIANSIFVFMIPAGIGLYYWVSGLFQAIEQFIYDLLCVRRMKLQNA